MQVGGNTLASSTHGPRDESQRAEASTAPKVPITSRREAGVRRRRRARLRMHGATL